MNTGGGTVTWCIGAAVTLGANSIIQGDINAGATITTEAGSKVYGDLDAAAAITTGAGACANDVNAGAAVNR